MGNTFYFKKKIKCVGGKESLQVEFGSSSYHRPGGLFLVVDGKGVTMNERTAKEFVRAVASLGKYLRLDE